MAQTKRKRQTKHRGNAAGVIESRGRTGRKPTAAEKSGKGIGATGKKEPVLARQDRPPTWLGAFYRAMVAAVLMLLSLFLIKQTNEAIALVPIVLALYVPISYYTDTWMFNRRMRKKAQGGGKAAAR
jgi:type IV secretory pathway VirB3-like protein